jgi:outer membrane protein insertion porin family
VPVTVTVAEGKPRRLQLGVGYGSEERGRASLQWQHLNFTGRARQATVETKWSAIDRGLRTGFMAPYLKTAGLSLEVTAGAWQTSHLTYDSQTYGGRVTLAYRTDRGGMERTRVGYRTRFSYATDYLRYGIRAEFLADQSRREERIALGLNPDTGRASGTLAAVEVQTERVALDNGVDPRRGTVVTAHLGVASPSLGGTYGYTEVGGELRGFLPLGSVVLAGRVRAATIAAADPATIPFSKRYFLGGSTSVRGWGRFQISPLNADGLPIGGRSVLDMSLEARVPVTRSIGAVVFADAGNVWRDQWTLDTGDLRWAAGAGLRYLTPVGAIRLDAAWQLTPIAGLIGNGEPLTRRWRVHFSIGQAF